MANTFTQIYMHIIFAVKSRRALIKDEWQDEVYRYLSGAIKKHESVPYIINGTEDHVHILLGMSPKESISEIVQSLKIESSKFIKQHYNHKDFSWQSGYAAFSYSKSFLPQVSNYIANQKNHHQKISFEDEFKNILKQANIEYDDRYIPHLTYTTIPYLKAWMLPITITSHMNGWLPISRRYATCKL